MTRWESNAIYCSKEYESYVDFEKRFYSCPFCDEPVYEDDWPDDILDTYFCPICEDADR